jgi:hypothetical protein
VCRIVKEIEGAGPVRKSYALVARKGHVQLAAGPKPRRHGAKNGVRVEAVLEVVVRNHGVKNGWKPSDSLRETLRIKQQILIGFRDRALILPAVFNIQPNIKKVGAAFLCRKGRIVATANIQEARALGERLDEDVLAKRIDDLPNPAHCSHNPFPLEAAFPQ